MTNWRGNGGGWGGDAPVWDTNFEYDFGGRRWPYPDVWVTVQACAPTPTRTGRDCVWRYTPEADPYGEQALSYGASYYDEGMACDLEERDKRVMCFQASELLYLHAASKGNPIAHSNLGYVYSYDRCEGEYWDRSDPPEDVSIAELWVMRARGELPRFDHEEAAYRHFRLAAEAGMAEACYKLGDLLREGRGCEADPLAAFGWYESAWELGRREHAVCWCDGEYPPKDGARLSESPQPVAWGSAALRLATAREEGEGCEQSFELARDWYERAATGLDIAVRTGEEWYRGALRRANDGLRRVRQELSGEW